jgi:cell division septation protein DedD
MSERGPRAGAEGWLPKDAQLIALVRDRGSDDWAAGVAVGLADMVGRDRRRTFLANVAGGDDALDRLMGSTGGPGLTSALTGAATVASIARTSPDQKFAYLPAGEAALPYSGLRRMQTFRRFLARVRDGGGTLLLYLGEEDLHASANGLGRRSAEPLRLDGCIALGEIAGASAKLGAPLLARVERPGPPPDPPPSGTAPAAAAQAELSSAEEQLAPTDTAPGMGSLVRLLIPMAAVVALLWIGWATAGPGGDAAGGDSDPAIEMAGPEAPGPARAEAAEMERGAEPEPDRTFSAPQARYSVLVGSYIRLGDAMSRRSELADDGGLFYVTPTPVRGRIYYRVLAGVYEDRADAATAMVGLVEDGRKDTNKEWDIRPVRLAFDLGTFASRDDADRRAAEALANDVPAYVLRDTASTPLYRVYAGAFTSDEDARPLEKRLEDLDSEAELITRAGVAP